MKVVPKCRLLEGARDSRRPSAHEARLHLTAPTAPRDSLGGPHFTGDAGRRCAWLSAAVNPRRPRRAARRRPLGPPQDRDGAAHAPSSVGATFAARAGPWALPPPHLPPRHPLTRKPAARLPFSGRATPKSCKLLTGVRLVCNGQLFALRGVDPICLAVSSFPQGSSPAARPLRVKGQSSS